MRRIRRLLGQHRRVREVEVPLGHMRGLIHLGDTELEYLIQEYFPPAFDNSILAEYLFNDA